MPLSDLELTFSKSLHGQYTIAMKLKREDDDAAQMVSAKPTAIDLSALQKKWELRDFVEYGSTLSKQVFSHTEIKDHFLRYFSDALDNQRNLRIRIVVADEAPELHSVIWETLQGPLFDQQLATMERVWLTRQILSANMRSTHVESKEKIKVLLAVSNPTDLVNYKLSIVDVEGETQRAKDALGQAHTIIENEKVTLATLLSDIRNGVDVVYLACHGVLANEKPILYLQKDDGTADKVDGEKFVKKLDELEKLPHLIVLASCQSAGIQNEKALTALGPMLAAIGVPAVLAMQGNISMETVKQFSPVFFSELSRHGQIDRALSVARSMVHHRPDFWMPVLFLRSESGKLWGEKNSLLSARKVYDSASHGLLPYLPNRAIQEECLRDAISHLNPEKPCPIIVIVHGNESQCHDTFIARLQENTLPELLNCPKINVFDITWEKKLRNLDEFEARLKDSMIKGLQVKSDATTQNIQNRFAFYQGSILLYFEITTDEWGAYGSDLLLRFVQFFQKWPELAPKQKLFISLSIKYRDELINWRQKIPYLWQKKRVSDFLRRNGLDSFENVVFAPLPELENVNYEDAIKWVDIKYVREFFVGDKERAKSAIRANIKEPDLPMEKLSIILREALTDLSKLEKEIFS